MVPSRAVSVRVKVGRVRDTRRVTSSIAPSTAARAWARRCSSGRGPTAVARSSWRLERVGARAVGADEVRERARATARRLPDEVGLAGGDRVAGVRASSARCHRVVARRRRSGPAWSKSVVERRRPRTTGPRRAPSRSALDGRGVDVRRRAGAPRRAGTLGCSNQSDGQLGEHAAGDERRACRRRSRRSHHERVERDGIDVDGAGSTPSSGAVGRREHEGLGQRAGRSAPRGAARPGRRRTTTCCTPEPGQRWPARRRPRSGSASQVAGGRAAARASSASTPRPRSHLLARARRAGRRAISASGLSVDVGLRRAPCARSPPCRSAVDELGVARLAGRERARRASPG